MTARRRSQRLGKSPAALLLPLQVQQKSSWTMSASAFIG